MMFHIKMEILGERKKILDDFVALSRQTGGGLFVIFYSIRLDLSMVSIGHLQPPSTLLSHLDLTSNKDTAMNQNKANRG